MRFKGKISNPWRGLKGIPKNIWLLSAATLINRSGTMVLPFLALYFAKELKVSVSEAGLALVAFGLGSLISAPFVGRLSDRFGPLSIMKLSLFASGFMLFLFSFIDNYNIALIVTFLWSALSEAFRPANLTFISNETAPEQRKTAFALNRIAINLGMSIGPVIGGILAYYNYHLLFYVDGVTSVMAAGFLMVSPFEKFHEEEVIKEAVLAPQKIYKDKRFIYYILALLPVEFVFFQHLGAVPIYFVKELHYTEAIYGILMAINTVIIIFVEVPLNSAMSHWRDSSSLALGSLLCAIGFGMMAFSANIYYLVLSIIVWTFGEMIFFPSSASFLSNIAPKDKVGEYMGYYQMNFSFSFMVAPWLGAIVLENYGSTILWGATFVLASISSIFLYRLKEEEN
ncbi:MAG: MFS transporter [Ignavibacteriaceae bacterium]|nr:MFS transporter [Ignavibacteriaceae bacterium]